MAVYDKAKWHFEGDFPKQLSSYQAFVHIGLFLGWVLDRSLEGELLRQDFRDEVSDYRAGRISATRLLQITDGVLDDQMLSLEASRFAEEYYDAHYLCDYARLFPNHETTYHVPDTVGNARMVSELLDVRYDEWKNKERRK
jgi:hypothetical protein